MWCRIQLKREGGRFVVHLAGHLSEAQVPELLAACAEATHPIVELDELISADAVGLDALVRVEQNGYPPKSGGQPPIVEEYTYSGIKTNVGLGDGDFDARNPKYVF